MNRGPNPDESYLSKYIVDFNKRELEKFFNPSKSPKAAFTMAALAVLVFVFIANFSPTKDKVFQALYPKPASQASITDAKLKINTPTEVSLNQEFTADLSISSADTKTFFIKLNYTPSQLRATMVDKDSSTVSSYSETKIDSTKGIITLSGSLSSPSGSIAKIRFTPKTKGESTILLDNSSKVYSNLGIDLKITPNNATIKIN